MPATELDILGTYLCCAEKFHYIKDAIDKRTSVAQLTMLRDQLRSRTAMNRLHFSLEKAFDKKIEELKATKIAEEKSNGTD